MHRFPDGAPSVPAPGPRGAVVGRAPGGRGPTGADPGAAPGRRRWVRPVAVGASTLAATALLAVRSPHVTGSYGVCPLLALTGLWCPACGGLRAVHELTRFDLAGAWSMNPLVVLGVPLLVLAWGLWVARSTGRLPSGRRRGAGGAWPAWTFLVVSATFTVARNVPVLEPWLAPV